MASLPYPLCHECPADLVGMAGMPYPPTMCKIFMNCYLNIRNPRSPTVPSSFSCDYCRGPFTLFSRRLSSNGVGQGEQSRVSNPLVDGRWTCGCWITSAKKVQGERNQACLKLLSRCLSSTKLIHPKTSIIRLSTIRAIEYD